MIDKNCSITARLWTLIVGVVSCVALQAGTIASKPNVIIILTDDQGYGDLGCFGGKVKTPRIDQMAKEGAKLTSFYMAGPVCTPSRAALMTGSYPKRIDMATGSTFGVILAGDTKGLNPNEVTIAELLKTAGYKTGMFGKWHLGDQPEFLPTRQGFDAFFGLPYSHDIHPYHPNQKKYRFPPLPLLEGETVVELDPDADYLTKRFTDRAVQFIETNKEHPFFLYLAHPIPHRPLHVSPKFMKDVPQKIRKKLEQEKDKRTIDYNTRNKIYAQAINEIDWSVGRILDTLKEQGIDKNTFVIFTSDNGPAVGSSGPLRGRKGQTFEGGMRVPTVVRWPSAISAGMVNDEVMTAMDLLPTVAKLAGVKVASDRVIDGKNMMPVLTEGKKSQYEAFFYHQGNKLQAVRSGTWKLIVQGNQPVSLFNLDEDIAEKKNVLKLHPEIADRLLSSITAFNQDIAAHSRPAGHVDKPKALSK